MQLNVCYTYGDRTWTIVRLLVFDPFHEAAKSLTVLVAKLWIQGKGYRQSANKQFEIFWAKYHLIIFYVLSVSVLG